ncbi:Crp/Fnr family transcriptional regulator [Sphingomicrobium arenosum]|uniref:Crp/Fnr family transcriptional regulator n=1 Tax=Sphingomicrobium arenosum TaxID=2233861 RepID=UPI00223F4248|nr:Crp/Fnr family transcriptional regulator [Sphingomicrobium arenosum]
MITKDFLCGRLRDALTETESQALEAAVHEVIEVPARTTLVKRGEKIDKSYYLVDGFMIRYLQDRGGYRQSAGIQVAGDWVDLHSFPMKRLDHDVATLGPVTLAVFKHEQLEKLIGAHPRLARIMWFSTLLDAAMHREWVFRLGRLNAEGRIAHLICELARRLEFVGRFDGEYLDVPLHQADYAEASGISAIHANRTFRLLRERGLIANREDHVGLTILDRAELEKIGEFDGDYLYGEGQLELSEPY